MNNLHETNNLLRYYLTLYRENLVCLQQNYVLHNNIILGVNNTISAINNINNQIILNNLNNRPIYQEHRFRNSQPRNFDQPSNINYRMPARPNYPPPPPPGPPPVNPQSGPPPGFYQQYPRPTIFSPRPPSFFSRQNSESSLNIPPLSNLSRLHTRDPIVHPPPQYNTNIPFSFNNPPIDTSNNTNNNDVDNNDVNNNDVNNNDVNNNDGDNDNNDEDIESRFFQNSREQIRNNIRDSSNNILHSSSPNIITQTHTLPRNTTLRSRIFERNRRRREDRTRNYTTNPFFRRRYRASRIYEYNTQDISRNTPRRRRARRGGFSFNTFTEMLDRELNNVLTNSLYDTIPNPGIARELYETVTETDLWSNFQTRHNLDNDMICPISRNTFTPEQEVIRINHCGHVFSNLLREWFTFSSRCPICRHNLNDSLDNSNNNISTNLTNYTPESKTETEQSETKNNETPSLLDSSANMIIDFTFRPMTIDQSNNAQNTIINQLTQNIASQITNVFQDFGNNTLDQSNNNLYSSNLFNDISGNIFSNFTTQQIGQDTLFTFDMTNPNVYNSIQSADLFPNNYNDFVDDDDESLPNLSDVDDDDSVPDLNDPFNQVD